MRPWSGWSQPSRVGLGREGRVGTVECRRGGGCAAGAVPPPSPGCIEVSAALLSAVSAGPGGRTTVPRCAALRPRRCTRSQHPGWARRGRPWWRSAGASGLQARGRRRSHVPGIAFERFASAINAWDGVSPFAGLRGPSTPRQRRFGAGNPSNSPPRSAVLCERPIWAITDFVGFSAYAGYPKDWPTGGAHLVIPANAGIHDFPLSRQLEVVDTGIRRHDGGHRWRVDHSDTRYYSAILDRSYGAPSTGRSIWRAGAEDGMIRCRRAAAEHPSLSGSARIMPPPALSRTLPAPPEPPPVPGP
jgi:hypothetical protein